MGDISAPESSAPTQGFEAPNTEKAPIFNHKIEQSQPPSSEPYPNYLDNLKLAVMAADAIESAGAKRDFSDLQSADTVTKPITPEKPLDFSTAETQQISKQESSTFPGAETQANNAAENQEKSEIETHKPKNVKSPEYSNAPTPPIVETKNTPEENKSLKSKIKDTASELAWKAKEAYTVVAQFGGIHPWRHKGEWVWVVEPWARMHDDPRQHGYSNESEFYDNRYANHKGRLIDNKEYGGNDPMFTLDGTTGSAQRLDHRRFVSSAKHGKAIIGKPVRFEPGVPKTFN